MVGEATALRSLRTSCVNLGLNANGGEVVIEVLLLGDLALFVELGLHNGRLDRLFLRLFNHRFHPVRVVAARLDVHVFEFLFDVGPDFSIFKEGVQLDDFHVLLFLKTELM